jgi:GGDEF domain-containing protein
MGIAARAPEETAAGLERPGMASGDLDSRALIVDEDTFALVLELEVRRALRLQYYVSVLALQVDAEARLLAADWTVLHRLIAEVIRDHIRNTDVVSVPSTPPRLQVLLVSPSLENLPAIIGRITSVVNARLFETVGAAVRVTLSLGGACFPTTARNRPELVRQAETLSIEARADPVEGGHRYRLATRAW